MLVRADLPRGVQAAQIVHAAGESSPGGLAEGTNAIVLAVANEPALAQLAETLERAGVRLRRIIEPDAPHNGALMALGLEPVIDRREVRRFTSSLPLLR